MDKIEVRAVEGRIARTAPDGPFIPHDRYIMVVKTSYIARLLEVHGDIELKPAPKQKAPEPEAEAPNPPPKEPEGSKKATNKEDS